MKKIFSLGASLLLFVFIIGSCTTSADVASNKMIQKRKHLKGYHISTKQSLFNKTKLKTESEEFLVINDVSQQIGLKFDKALRHDSYLPVELDEKIAEVDLGHHTIAAKESKAHTVVNSEKETSENVLSNNSQVTSKKQKVKFLKNELKSSDESGNAAGVALILLVILCFFLPPLAVFLKSGLGTQFIISLILTLLFWLPGVIYSLLVVLDVI